MPADVNASTMAQGLTV